MIGGLLAAVLSSTATDARIDAIVLGREGLPPLAEVQAGVARGLGGDDDLAARARIRGLVPRIDLRFDTNSGLDLRDSTTGVTWLASDRRTLGFEVGLRFDLGDVALGEGELRARRQRTAERAAIRLAIDEVTELYFRRIELLLRAELEPPSLAHRIEAKRLDAILWAYARGQPSP